MTTITATVNPRLLRKASRLFTGTLAGRIIEILQNARRAHAQRVQISNHDGVIIVQDDGTGIEDFQKLLDLGGSGWEARLEASEDPAGVGLFCLAPRQLTIRSNGQVVTIADDGWTGAPVEVRLDPQPLPRYTGTELSFADESWTLDTVKPLAAFTGLAVTVDGQKCPKEQFITGQSSHHPELGCRIKVVRDNGLAMWRRSVVQSREFGGNVLVNFHGQVIVFSYRPVTGHDLTYLVDMTGETTGIRLMLPARTCLVENPALGQLQPALELEAFKYLQSQKHHRLPYKQYLRARELGIALPEAEPVFRVGLLWANGGYPEPVEVDMPKGHALGQCYRLADIPDGDESDEANVHLLAALGQFDQPFVPVHIGSEYDGYAWAKLPTVGRVQVTAGKKLQETWINGGTLICVDALTIAAHGSDGKVFHSAVCMAIKPPEPAKDGKRSWFGESEVYVTPPAQHDLGNGEIWFHLGGYSEDGDTYETQEYDFDKELDAFWLALAGPEEPLRCKLLDCLSELAKGWQSVTIQPDGQMTIIQGDGITKTLLPPKPAVTPAGTEQAIAAKDEATLLHVDARELATILAALRYHQAENLQGAAAITDQAVSDIATDGGTLKPLDSAELDQLCQRLNLENTTAGLTIQPPPRDRGEEPVFRVVYSIDVNAADARQAADHAHRIMVDPQSQLPVLQVMDHNGTVVTLDLSGT